MKKRKMIHENIEIHNVENFETIPGIGEYGLVRIPAAVRNHLNKRARFVSMNSIGCELRFVTESPDTDIYFSLTKPEFLEAGVIKVYKGNHLCSTTEIMPGTTSCIRLTEPEQFSQVDRSRIDKDGFSSKIWRVGIHFGGIFVLHGIDSHGFAIRPPAPHEKPKIKWLAYGSSITSSSLDGYPHFAARLLKIDVQNKGLSGACECENELADWIAENCEWDILSCEMGINMRGQYSPLQFEERVEYLLKKVTSVNPEKSVVAISPFPNGMSSNWTAVRDNELTVKENAYEATIEKVVRNINSSNLHFVKGSELLSDFSGLSGDMTHPCLFGHAVIGTRLATTMSKILKLS